MTSHSGIASSQQASCWTKLKEFVLYEPRQGSRLPWYWFIIKNRYCRLCWYCFAIISTTIVYYGWQPFSGMLFRRGAYEWLCDADYDFSAGPCREQDKAVQSLFQIGLASEFIVGVVAGCFLDWLGPLLTALCGELVCGVGWLLLIFSNQGFVAYTPAIICLGGAVNLISFPCLILGDFFPTRTGLAMSIVVACQTAATGVAPIMDAIWKSHPSMNFSSIGWGYIFCFVVPSFCLFIFTMPVKRPICSKADDEGGSTAAVAEFGVTREGNSLTAPPAGVPPNNKINNLSDPDLSFDGGALEHRFSTAPEGVLEPVHSPTASVEFKPPQQRWSVLYQICTIEMAFFTCYYVAQLLQFSYYPTIVRSHSGENISDFQGWLMPSQALWGILFGAVVDRTGTLLICAILVVCMSLVYALVMINSVGLQYATSMFYIISNSYIYTVKYTYCNEIFPPENFGVLIGFVGLMGGLFTLVNIPVSNADKFIPTSIGYLCTGGVCLVILAFLAYRKRKGYTYKEDDSTPLPRSPEDTDYSKISIRLDSFAPSASRNMASKHHSASKQKYVTDTSNYGSNVGRFASSKNKTHCAV